MGLPSFRGEVMTQILDSLKNYFSQIAADTILRIIGAMLVVFIGFWIAEKITRLFNKSVLFTKMEKNGAVLIRTVMSIFLKALVIFTAAAIIGIPTTSLITLVGSLGLATGLALQGSLTNFAGGILIIAFKSFKIGDWILPASGDGGTVSDIGIFYTTIITLDNSTVVLPNGTLSNQAVKNVSAFPTRRLELKFTVDYRSDMKLVKKLIEEAVMEHPFVLKEEQIFIRLNSLENATMVFVMRVWCKTQDYWTAYFDLLENIKSAFDNSGIAIAPPQLEVHLKSAPEIKTED